MSDVFDLDAFNAEREQIPFEFVFGGEKFSLPPGFDLRVAEELQTNPLAAFRRLLDDQWDRFVAVPALFDQAAAGKLLDQYLVHLGMRPGESEGSSS